MMPLPAARSHKTFAFSALYVLVAALAMGLVAVRPVHAKDPSTVPALKRVEAKSQAVVAKVLGATVGIINQSLAGNGHIGEGSGVVVSEDGLVLTAGHVLGQPGAELTIIFPDGRRATAKALGANFTRDSGVAKITEPGKWPHVEMGHSDDIKPGSWCMALGHPGGVQQGRTPPIRLGRILVSGKTSKFLVSDATVISGDSGGPLFDLEGRVIGIHSNIGTSVNQNQHVPIDVYREQWNDLLAGKTFGSPHDMQHSGNIPSPEKLKRFHELLLQRMAAGDPEVMGLMQGGRLNVSPDDIDRLIAKWEKAAAAPAAGGNAAGENEPLDFLKFQRLFQDRLVAGDPEVLGLIKEGKMMVAPAQMHHLMDQWEQKSLAAGESKPKPDENAAKTAPAKPATGPAKAPAADKAQSPKIVPQLPAMPEKAKPEDLAKLRELMKHAEPLGDGRFRFHGASDINERIRGIASTVMNYGKSCPQMLREIAPIAAQAGRSTVVVLCDGKPAVLGTVVRKDGYVLTKASEIHGKLTCRIAGRELPATVVKTKTEHDLALLKVDAADLAPIAWADADSPVPGSWLITPSAENDALGLGVVSIAARTIPDAPKMLMRNRAIVGVMLDQEAKNAIVQQVTSGLPAARAGLKPGDVIDKIDGQAMIGPKAVNQFLGKYKPGDKITLEITRAGKPLKLTANLVSSDEMAPKSSAEQLTRLSEAGGTVSKRHNSFVSAFTHDTVLQATDCGGPVVNLDGRAVGLNIARADRTATYAIPGATLRKIVAELLPK